jgi:soluble lytic murein transglycosylase
MGLSVISRLPLRLAIISTWMLMGATYSWEPKSPVRFSTAYKNEKLAGISLETDRSNLNFAESPSEIQRQFEFFSAYKNNQMPVEQQKEWIELCHTAPISASSPFCPFYLRESWKKAKSLGLAINPDSRAIELRLSRAQALQSWKTNHWELLAGRSEAEVQPILSTINSAGSALFWAEKILKKSQCLSSPLLFGIGVKLESAFPKEEYRVRAEALYQMALNCGQDTASVAAGYRLGLFKIWRGQFEEAESILSKIPDLPHSSDYRMRIGYWRYYCADKIKDEVLKAKLRAWVTREYPLSLHSLLVHSSKFGSDLQWQEAADPEVSLRPKDNANLSLSTAAIEYFLLKNDRTSARYLLSYHQDAALQEPPAFRLYWAILLKRAGNHSDSFRFMASAFREEPRLIARSTLEILYPNHFLELVPNEPSRLDRFFILSIIRQESAFDPSAQSGAKAMGLMQLQLPTARNYEKRVTREQLFDPETNIRIGNKYISRLVQNESGAIELALASYNAGPGRIRQWKARYPIPHHLLLIDLLPARETREYVSSILRNYFWYTKIYSPERSARTIAGRLEPYIRSMIPNP